MMEKVLTDKKMWLQGGLSFLLGRVIVYGMNPIGLGFFLAAYGMNQYRFLLVAGMLCGLITSRSAAEYMKYIVAMAVIMVVNGLYQKFRKKSAPIQVAAIGAATTTILSVTNIALTGKGLALQEDRKSVV